MKESSQHLGTLLGPSITEGVGPAYLRLAAGLRALIADGRLPTGTRLPSERQLAATLGLSRTTVTSAYDALRTDGYADSRQGSGTRTRRPGGQARLGERSPIWATSLPVDDESEGVVDLTQAAIPANVPAVESAYHAALDHLPAYLARHGYAVAGLDVLRRAVANWYARRGLPTDPDQVMITSGAQQAISIIAERLVSPGDRVLVDHPTYPGAIDGFHRFGARLVPVPLAEGGRDLVAFRSTVAQTAPRLAYLVVDFHNPTGLLADDAERQALADTLAAAHVTTVVDETLVDVVLDDVPAPMPFAALARSVISIGSSSKPFWGGLRIGWIRAERRVIERLVSGRAAVDYASPVLEQLVVAQLLTDDSTALADLATMLRSRRAAVLDAAADLLPSWRVAVPHGGLSLWFDIGAPVSTRLVHAAADRGVLLAVGPRFGVDGSFENRLRIPYGAAEHDLREGIARIADVWADLDRRVRVPAAGRVLV